jgi:ribokinase
MARIDGQILVQPAFSISPVDTTAAGDTFCGTLIARLAQNAPLQQALLAASAASALTCTRLGAQSSIPDHAEVETLLADASRLPGSNAHAALAAWCAL